MRALATLNGMLGTATGRGPQVAFLKAGPHAARPECPYLILAPGWRDSQFPAIHTVDGARRLCQHVGCEHQGHATDSGRHHIIASRIASTARIVASIIAGRRTSGRQRSTETSHAGRRSDGLANDGGHRIGTSALSQHRFHAALASSSVRTWP